jgi:glycosyltransferase involved in cell wall biosynthesis
MNARQRLRFLFLEPFFGGSHADFALGLAQHSRHKIEISSLPARFWKWRMRGAALHFFRKAGKDLSGFDGLIVGNLMSLADFKALAGSACPPVLVYFHENQLTYPLAPGEAMDYQFGFTDITTALCAQRILFNSCTHQKSFFEAIGSFIGRMPEYRPKWAVEEIRKKSGVLYPGCRFPAVGLPPEKRQGPPLVIWNHRWEFDKNPDEFFAALYAAAQRGIDFRVALLGENFQFVPKPFLAAKEKLGEKIVQYGFVEDRQKYFEWLSKGHVAVSTALQENFGISVVEALRFGCLPLLPERLSYPEILPRQFASEFLYNDFDDLVEKLCKLLANPVGHGQTRKALSLAMAAHSWENRIAEYDAVLEELVSQKP